MASLSGCRRPEHKESTLKMGSRVAGAEGLCGAGVTSDGDALPALSDCFCSQSSGLPGDGKRCDSPADFPFKPSTRLMPFLLILLG